MRWRSVIASVCSLATVRWSLPSQNGTAPAAGDTLLLHFNVPLQTRPVETQATLDALIVFTPPIKNVTYVGRFVGARMRVVAVASL
jgi:hypothetical protein